MRHIQLSCVLFCTFIVCCLHRVNAQQVIAPTNANDTVRIIEIVQGKSLRERSIDTSVFETIAGNVILKEGKTIFTCDSASINRNTNILEAFGNVHINQNDSIHTYAQYLKYIGKDRVAFMQKKVKMTDKKGTLFTDEFEYNLGTGIGKYTNGGKVVNGSTTLTSNDGVYYADTKDVYFKNNVHLVDPKYNIVTDSLVYNTQTQAATFISQTYIKSKSGGDIYTKEGTYDLKNGKAYFGKRTVIKDSTRTFVSDNSAYDEKTGIAQLEGNAVIRDSVNGYTILGNQIFINKNNNSFLATHKPVLIFKGEANDSTFIAADTLFSGVKKTDTSLAKNNKQSIDTIKKTTVVKAGSDSTIRFFLAFHKVRIFNDSLQAVCDSLLYSSQDSVFRLYTKPVVFSNRGQIAGDTIFLYLRNKKPDRFYVFNHGNIINKANALMYNQISGRTINGYFSNGALNYVRVKGSPAQSIYYPQNNDSAYIGMNKSTGDVIDAYFENKQLRKIKFTNDVNGTLYPIKQIPKEEKYIKDFHWQEDRRPKNRWELFE